MFWILILPVRAIHLTTRRAQPRRTRIIPSQVKLDDVGPAPVPGVVIPNVPPVGVADGVAVAALTPPMGVAVGGAVGVAGSR